MLQTTKKTLQHSPFQSPSKFTEIGIFGLKTNHLATLVFTWIKSWRIHGLTGFNRIHDLTCFQCLFPHGTCNAFQSLTGLPDGLFSNQNSQLG
jgi:hypothetical protein